METGKVVKREEAGSVHGVEEGGWHTVITHTDQGRQLSWNGSIQLCGNLCFCTWSFRTPISII